MEHFTIEKSMQNTDKMFELLSIGTRHLVNHSGKTHEILCAILNAEMPFTSFLSVSNMRYISILLSKENNSHPLSLAQLVISTLLDQ